MDTFMSFLSKYHLTADVCVLSVALGGQFDNHLWRFLVVGLSYTILYHVFPLVSIPTLPSSWAFVLLAIVIVCIPHLRFKQKKKGCVFVTGADSGMGQATVIHLAKQNNNNNNKKNNNNDGYDYIFAGAYDALQTITKLKQLCDEQNADYSKIVVLPLDVTNDESVALAATQVRKRMKESPKSTVGLTALINYHGVAFNGPVEYMPLDMYVRQHDVNYMGNIRMTQHFLPLIKEACSGSTANATRGRIIYTGTGGGPCSPCPPLLSAYMSSKFACEAFAQCLRMELHMTNQPIDCCVINPGFVKPTMLMEEGKKLTDRMWKACEDKMGNTKAKDVYGPMMDHFIKYSSLVPGTHVSKVCEAAEHALTAYRPRSSYKVGIDSKLAPIVGMLPTGVRELISLHGMYGVLSPAGTIKGYKV